MRYGQFERVEIRLRILAPVFIGSGEELSKKEYIFDKTDGMIHMPDLAKFTSFLYARSLIPAFQEFVLHPKKNDLYFFLSENGIGKKDYPSFVSYSIDAGEAASSSRFRSVLTFIKGPDGRPYIPGSSLKGVIRTAIAAKLLERGNFERNISEIERASEDFTSQQMYISKEAEHLENRLFCKLNIRDPRDPDRVAWNDIVNDFMRGISISDSLPIGFENLTLCGKYDRKPDGSVQQLPIFRECLAPGTETVLILTIDKLVLDRAGIDRKYIEDALRSFSDLHYRNFEQYFSVLPQDSLEEREDGIKIILGGGSGYVSKTLTYPLIRERVRAVKLVSKIMAKQFGNHRHEKDFSTYKVSPRTIKTTLYKGYYYQMGMCELVLK